MEQNSSVVQKEDSQIYRLTISRLQNHYVSELQTDVTRKKCWETEITKWALKELCATTVSFAVKLVCSFTLFSLVIKLGHELKCNKMFSSWHGIFKHHKFTNLWHRRDRILFHTWRGLPFDRICSHIGSKHKVCYKLGIHVTCCWWQPVCLPTVRTREVVFLSTCLCHLCRIAQ